MLVNDYFGGEIVWADAVLLSGEKISHYFNLINGKVFDLTRSQFPSGTMIPEGIEKKKEFSNTREFMLSSENTKRRYELLKNIVEENL